MAHLLTGLSPKMVSALGWTLLHSLWQATVLAAAAAILVRRLRDAKARYSVALAALILVLVAAVATFWLAWEPEGHAAATTTALEGWLHGKHLLDATLDLSAATAARVPTSQTFAWLVSLWLVGVSVSSLRLAGGLWAVVRLRRQESTAVCAKVHAICEELRQLLGITRPVRYRQTTRVETPAVAGWWHPVIFLPISALTGLSEEQLRLVIAHELAHIRRWDTLVNLLQAASETLFFYHPAVWWLNRSIRAEREHCCDDAALSVCPDRLQYARALAFMAGLRAAPALAMGANRGSLTHRVARILRVNQGRRRWGLSGGLVVLLSALLVGHVLAQAHSASGSDHRHDHGSTAAKYGDRPSEIHPDFSDLARVLRANGLSPSRQQLLAMNNHGLNATEAQQLLALLPDLNTKTLIAIRATGITVEQVRAALALGLPLQTSQMIAWHHHGVTPRFAQALREQGLQLDADQLIAFRVHGITPEFVASHRAQGMNLNIEQLMAFRIHGVSPAVLSRFRDLGLPLNARQALSLRIHGVTPDFAQSFLDQGLSLTIERLLALRIHGVTAEEARDHRGPGGEPLSVSRLLTLKKHGLLKAPPKTV